MTLTGAGTVAAVIGWPIAHSKSPQLHQYWLDRHGIDGVVVPLAIDPAQLEQALRALPALGLAGCSVTIPHKESCIPFLDEVTPLVTGVGACNMIKVSGDRLIGDNTDVFGFAENLRLGAPDARWDGTALVLGAGGAARAVVAGLAELGVPDIVVANRTVKRAEQLADQMAGSIKAVAHGNVSIRFVPWEDISALLPNIRFLINATSLGMAGQPPLTIDLSGLSSDCVVNDIVYQPLETDLLRGASARGCVTVDGLGMLLHQARPAFKAWFGIDPTVEDQQRQLILGST